MLRKFAALHKPSGFLMAHVWAIGKSYSYMKKVIITLVCVSSVFPAIAFVAPTVASPQVPLTFSSSGNLSRLGNIPSNASNIGNFGLSTASDGSLLVSTKGRMPLSGGGSLPLDVVGRVPKANLVGALGRFMTKSLPLLGAGVALYDLAREVGFTFSNNPAGGVTILKDGDRGADAGKVCNAPYAPPTESQVSNYGPGTRYFTYNQNGTCITGNTFPGWYDIKQSTGSGTWVQGQVSSVPSSTQEFLDAVAAKSGWPSGSALAETMRDAIKAGEEVQVEPQTVTGPATSPGVKVQTTSAVGVVSTVNTVNNYTYEGATVTITNNTTTTTTDPATGATTTATSVVTPDLPDSKPEKDLKVCGLTKDTACKIDETGTKPDAGTTYDQPKADLDAAKTSAIDAVNTAKDIVAPAWTFTFQLPTGCAPYVTGIRGFILNVCPFQPQIHGLLSAVWAAATVFAMIGMVGRTIRSA